MGDFPEAASKDVKEIREQVTASSPPGDRPWEEGPPAPCRHRASSVSGPQGHSAPSWFCLWGDKGGSCLGTMAWPSDQRPQVFFSHPE